MKYNIIPVDCGTISNTHSLFNKFTADKNANTDDSVALHTVLRITCICCICG